MRVGSQKGGPTDDVGSVGPGPVLMARPHPDVRRRQRRGAELRGEAQGRPFHPGATGKGKTGRVDASEPSLMPRYVEPRVDGSPTGVQGLAAGKRQVAAGDSAPVVRAPPSPGSRGHPTRSQLDRAERGIPMGSRRLMLSGRPTARKAETPSGERMTREANAGGRKATGTRDRWSALPPAVPHNWPDRGTCPDPKGCRRGSGGPAER